MRPAFLHRYMATKAKKRNAQSVFSSEMSVRIRYVLLCTVPMSMSVRYVYVLCTVHYGLYFMDYVIKPISHYTVHSTYYTVHRHTALIQNRDISAICIREW